MWGVRLILGVECGSILPNGSKNAQVEKRQRAEKAAKGRKSGKKQKKQQKELVEVGHHLAHIYACMAEFGLNGDYLGFSFDGTGYGEEKVNGEAREAALGHGTLWGGEVFVGDKRKCLIWVLRSARIGNCR